MTRILIAVLNPGLQITPQTLPPAAENQPYSVTLRVLFGELPIKITIVSGVLPDGLTLVDNGDGTATISGTPTETGDFAIEVEYVDVREDPRMQPYVVRVADVPAPPVPIVVSGTAPAGTVGTPYTYTFTATGGNGGPYTWSVVSGSLPSGVTLNSTNGTISGTPTSSIGSPFAFVVQADDGVNVPGQSGSQSVTVVDIPDADFVTWVGNGAGSRAITVSVDMTAGGLLLDYSTTSAIMVLSANGSTWYDSVFNSVANANSGNYSVTSSTVTVPSARNTLGVVYRLLAIKRNPGVLDVVTYAGTGTAQNIAHALGDTPELLLVKKVVGASTAYGVGATPSELAAEFRWPNDGMSAGTSVTAMSSTSVSLTGGNVTWNAASRTYVAVVIKSSSSKIASGIYSGNGGSSPHIIAGFEADFVFVRGFGTTVSGMNWPVFDTYRNPSFTGNETPMLLNTQAEGAAIPALEYSGGNTVINGISSQINGISPRKYFYLAVKK